MSFVIAFNRFLQVTLEDADGEPVNAFEIRPTARTRRLLADHRIVFKPGVSGLTLYAISNPAASPAVIAPISARTRFSFTMRLIEAGFFERFHPDFGSGGGQILLDNLDAAGAIQTGGLLTNGATVEAVDTVAVGPNPFPLRLDVSGGAPAAVELQDRFSAAVVGTAAIDVDPGAVETIALIGAPDGTDAALRAVSPAPAPLNRLVYVDEAIAQSNVVGVIDLYWDQSQSNVPADTGAIFSAVFRPRP